MATYTFIPASGPSITFGKAPPYILERTPQGLSGMAQDIRLLRAPQQDGATLVDSRMRERAIHFPITIWADSEGDMWTARRNLVIALNADLGVGAFQVMRPDTKVFSIAVKPDSGTPDILEARHYAAHRALIDFLAPHSLWFSLEGTELLTAGAAATQFTNNGDVEAPIEVIFNGPSVDPTLTNTTTGKFIKILRTLVSGEKYTVITGFGAPSAVRTDTGGTETDAMQFLSLDSDLFFLGKGNSDLAYTESGGGAPGQAEVKHRDWFVGI